MYGEWKVLYTKTESELASVESVYQAKNHFVIGVRINNTFWVRSSQLAHCSLHMVLTEKRRLQTDD